MDEVTNGENKMKVNVTKTEAMILGTPQKMESQRLISASSLEKQN
jgi:hypothetical protein